MWPYRLVKDWMTTEPITVSRDTPVNEAHQIMLEHHVRRLPVVEGDEVVGIVTLGDVRGSMTGAARFRNWDLRELRGRLTVERVMTTPVVRVPADATIREAARLMKDNKIAGLPVVEDGQLVGIITESDVFRLVVDMWESKAVLA